MSIAVVIGTFNRAPGPNYLGGLLDSLRRSGLWTCGLLDQGELHICDGGSASLEHLDAVHPKGGESLVCHFGTRKMSANDNFQQMARVGVKTGAEWVVTLECDVLVSKDFLSKIDDWVQTYAVQDYAMFPLYCPYQDVAWAKTRGERTYKYIISSYYGTQACLWRREALASYVQWYEAKGKGRPCFWDMLIKDWAQELLPEQPYFLTPVGSLVQHVGSFSALGLHDRFHTAPCVEELA